MPTTPKPEDEDPEDESAPSLLANDLALARLIRESHLLDGFRGPSSSLIPSSSAGGTPTMELHGRARLLATDMRVRALTDGNKHKASASSSVAALSSIVAAGTKSRSGGVAAIKESIYAQRNRPGLIARGIAAAAAKREEKRRREARETGQVLERFGGVSKNSKKRSKGKSGLDPGLPSVGRMRGAELKLRERDIRRIEQQGPHRSGGGRGKGGRGGRRR